ncbi:PREDICTED: O-glucosyltransferase rumi homolog [Ceratosolen solmsi marchali]|uniref:O-glucosyltransferase rumi homolog n=1 Tax=Ceratosolen solmsi marchali TaxID=326594 RepID=A0AAJ6YNH0_9HYME|nr:PREDICTED: O-glucosyltransferase rumi homolog [Ceratosolen solmsi marchali]
MILLLHLIISIFIHNVESKIESCSSNKEDTCIDHLESNKYSEVTNAIYEKYLRAIEKSEAEYTECKSKKCKCFGDIIDKDLKIFAEHGIDEELINTAKSRGTFYQIINGNLYREKNCMFPSRCNGIQYFISKLVDNLPNISFIINTRDYPQSSKYFGEPLPIFSFSKTAEYDDITYPAWTFWEGGPAISLYPRGLGRWDLHRKSLNKASRENPWDEKEEKAFFRGSRTSSERDNLILLSRAKPELADAQYTKNQAWKSEKDTLNSLPATEASLESHCSYKYLFNYRGVAASFRHKHLFLCGSLVFHVGNEWTEFYYHAMKPWIHYIPVPKNATQKQLEELIRFAKDHDTIVKKIADRGRNFIWERLKLSDVICYWKRLLKQYSKLFKYKPTLNADLIRI